MIALNRRSVVFIWSLVFTTLLTVCRSHAQFSAEIMLDREGYVLYEPIQLIIKATSESSQVLDMNRMSGERPWLNLLLARKDNSKVSQQSDWKPPSLTLLPGQTRVIGVNLTPVFFVRSPGEYQLFVRIYLNDREVASQTLLFTLSKGVTIWKKNFQVYPDPKNAPKDSQIREYSLVVNKGDEGLQRLYARVMNPDEQKVYCTTEIGTHVLMTSPKAMIDRHGTLHVLHQTAPRLLQYVKFDMYGKMSTPRQFSNITSTPDLSLLGNDEMDVVGGEEILPKKESTSVNTKPSSKGF